MTTPGSVDRRNCHGYRVPKDSRLQRAPSLRTPEGLFSHGSPWSSLCSYPSLFLSPLFPSLPSHLDDTGFKGSFILGTSASSAWIFSWCWENSTDRCSHLSLTQTFNQKGRRGRKVEKDSLRSKRQCRGKVKKVGHSVTLHPRTPSYNRLWEHMNL